MLMLGYERVKWHPAPEELTLCLDTLHILYNGSDQNLNVREFSEEASQGAAAAAPNSANKDGSDLI